MLEVMNTEAKKKKKFLPIYLQQSFYSFVIKDPAASLTVFFAPDRFKEMFLYLDAFSFSKYLFAYLIIDLHFPPPQSLWFFLFNQMGHTFHPALCIASFTCIVNHVGIFLDLAMSFVTCGMHSIWACVVFNSFQASSRDYLLFPFQIPFNYSPHFLKFDLLKSNIRVFKIYFRGNFQLT